MNGHRVNRRSFIGAAAGFALAAPRLAFAQAYPSRPVRVIIPFTPGGAPDVLLRLVAQKLSEKWGQGVVVENRAGGNTLTGTVAATKSPPDGYTLLMTADQTFILNPLLYAIAAVFDEGARPDHPDGVDPAHAGGVAQGAGVEREGADRARQGQARHDDLRHHRPRHHPAHRHRIFRRHRRHQARACAVSSGANETTTAILSGEIDITINGMSNILPHIEGGKLKALAISTAARAIRSRPISRPCRRPA